MPNQLLAKGFLCTNSLAVITWTYNVDVNGTCANSRGGKTKDLGPICFLQQGFDPELSNVKKTPTTASHSHLR